MWNRTKVVAETNVHKSRSIASARVVDERRATSSRLDAKASSRVPDRLLLSDKV